MQSLPEFYKPEVFPNDKSRFEVDKLYATSNTHNKTFKFAIGDT
jgi:hypothetical protein